MSDTNKDGGAFWYATDRQSGKPKTTKKGDRYMTGSITIDGVKHAATLFYNKTKEKESWPDITISINTGGGGGFTATAPAAPATESGIRVEDIPF